MSTVKPPPPLSVSAPRTAPAAPLALAVRASEVIRALSVERKLEATRVDPSPAATAAKGTIQVKTVLGPITLQTAFPVPKGAILSLVLIQQGPQPQFQITAINAKPVIMPSRISPGTPEQPAVPPARALAPGQTLNAILLRPALLGPALLGPTPGTPQTTLSSGPDIRSQTPTNPQIVSSSQKTPGTGAGTGVETGRITGPKPGIGNTIPNAGREGQPASRNVAPDTLQTARATPRPDVLPKGSAQLPAPTSRTPPDTPPSTTKSTGPVVLPTGTRLRVTVQRLEAPNTAVSTPVVNLEKETSPALTVRSILTGTLSGRTTQGQPIVQTPGALFALDTRTTSLDGTRLTVRLDSPPQPPSKSLPFSDTPTSTANWSNLNEALKALASVDPGRLVQVAARALPQPGAKLGTQMLFFLSALRGGDVGSLFGDTAMRLIDKKRPGLLSRLDDDFRTMSKHADETQKGDWRAATIPMWSGTQLEQVRFYWRHANAHDTVEEDGEETRFVLDVDLSRMGHLQIDGLLKTKRQHMDLIVRTDAPLPVEWRREIADIFNQGREITGFGGSVAFQAVPANFVPLPTEQTPQSTPGFYA